MLGEPSEQPCWRSSHCLLHRVSWSTCRRHCCWGALWRNVVLFVREPGASQSRPPQESDVFHQIPKGSPASNPSLWPVHLLFPCWLVYTCVWTPQTPSSDCIYTPHPLTLSQPSGLVSGSTRRRTGADERLLRAQK